MKSEIKAAVDFCSKQPVFVIVKHGKFDFRNNTANRMDVILRYMCCSECFTTFIIELVDVSHCIIQ